MPTSSTSPSDHDIHATVVFVGHHQSGKSTATGHLLVKLGGLDRRAVERVERETSNRPTSRYAWVLDRSRLERDRAMSLDLKLSRLVLPASMASASAASDGAGSAAAGARYSGTLVLTLVDTPGHPDYLRNAIAGITQADVAVIVVDSRSAMLESPTCSNQTRDLAQLATNLTSQRTLVVAVNHMDVALEATDPALAEQRFKDACEVVRKLTKRPPQSVTTFVPVSGYTGDNLAEPSPRLPWWQGPTLLKAIIDAVRSTAPSSEAAAMAAALPLRIPLIGVFKVGGIGTVPAGRLAGGNLRKGAAALLLPPPAQPPNSADATAAATAATAAESTSTGPAGDAPGAAAGQGALAAAVRSIESFHDSCSAASAGEWVGAAVKGVPTWRLRRGCVLSDEADRPARLAESFTAKIQVHRDPTSKREGRSRSLRPGYTALVHVHTAQAPCRLESIRRCNNKWEVVEANAAALQEGDLAEVELRPLRPLVVEPFRDYPQLGRFAVRAAVRSERLGLGPGPDPLGAQGAGGGGGGGGGSTSWGSAMTPIIVALGRVESVKYVEARSAARKPSAEQSGAAKRAAAGEAPISSRPRARAANANDAGAAGPDVAVAAAARAVQAAEAAKIPIIDICSDGELASGDEGA